jgi:enoyl reductase-like protein
MKRFKKDDKSWWIKVRAPGTDGKEVWVQYPKYEFGGLTNVIEDLADQICELDRENARLYKLLRQIDTICGKHVQ